MTPATSTLNVGRIALPPPGTVATPAFNRPPAKALQQTLEIPERNIQAALHTQAALPEPLPKISLPGTHMDDNDLRRTSRQQKQTKFYIREVNALECKDVRLNPLFLVKSI